MKLFKKKMDNNGSVEIGSMIGFLVCFGLALIAIFIVYFVNNI